MATFNTGDGNDIITGSTNELYGWGIRNSGSMDTGNGNDIITGTNIIGGGVGIWNEKSGSIDTGDGNDLITAIGQAGLYNFGSINTGNGTDSIILDGYNQIGSVFLGNAQDYFKGFGNGVLDGGNGKDILELTSGNYTVGISGTTVKFSRFNSTELMNDILITTNFERLIAGSTIYNFANLTEGQAIVVA
jgi:Ca2+-binding RTX toxin-like protein